MSKVFVTYDLDEAGMSGPREIYRGAHEVPIDADQLVGWDVGEFKRAWGRDVYGVKIRYRPHGRGSPLVNEDIIEVPANAQNVRVHFGALPEEYRPGLKSAA